MLKFSVRLRHEHTTLKLTWEEKTQNLKSMNEEMKEAHVKLIAEMESANADKARVCTQLQETAIRARRLESEVIDKSGHKMTGLFQ